MSTAREHFDRNTHLEVGVDFTIEGGSKPLTATAKVASDFDGGGKYIKVYVPETPILGDVLRHILGAQLSAIWEADANVQVLTAHHEGDEQIDKASLKFTGRVLVFTPMTIDRASWRLFADELLAKDGLALVLRDGEYVRKRDEIETPVAFISHDSRDKEPFVREMAVALQKMLCPVWYDEFSLVPGQSLRESIENGLKRCPKAVVVLSKNFFQNPGWARREFDTLYTKEIVGGHRVMIPVWLDVTKEEVYEYSPILLDTFGISGSKSGEDAAKRVAAALNYTPPAWAQPKGGS